MNTAIQTLPTYIQERVSSATVPVKYSAAVKALAACRNIDDAKYFSDKAEALAVWAKIYKNDEAKIEAQRLRLHAYRRMGILAREIRPGGAGSNPGRNRGRGPGVMSVLKGVGLAPHQASASSAISKLSEKRFGEIMKSVPPPAPGSFSLKLSGVSDAWKALTGHNGSTAYTSMTGFRCFCRKSDPKKLAKSLSAGEVGKAREMITEIIEWADTFDQYLPDIKG